MSIYDDLNRKTRMWTRDKSDEHVTLRKLLIYGDDHNYGSSRETQAAKNLLGKNHKHFDDAGLLRYESYDACFYRKRYRFTDKEKDEESGLYYHGSFADSL